MNTARYHVFGLGLDGQDVRYIGWTRRSLRDEHEQIVSELADSQSVPVQWMDPVDKGIRIDLFEIEAVPTAEAAEDSTSFWRSYFRSLGLDVIPGNK